MKINSYNTHQFVIKFAKPIPGVEVRFKKGPKEETVTVTYNKEENYLTVKITTKFDDLMDKVHNTTSTCKDLKKGIDFDECFAHGIASDIVQIEESKTLIGKYRDLMSSRLRNYTCADETMNSTKPLSSTSVKIGNKMYEMDSFFETERAKIWVVHDFITDSECETLRKVTQPLLTRATVAAEDGSSIVSENRKAQQAGYNLHQINPEDPLNLLQDRILQHTNDIAGYKLSPAGQEDFTVIQYNKDDQYTPHCDGDCTGSLYNPGGRVATAVMYCEVPTKGGATTFTKADVFIKPTKGMATFFSYKGADGYMEDGYTEHSGCPVLEGEKWITTLWMREGVSHQEPWTMFDPSGIKMETSVMNEDEEEVEEAEVGVNGDEL